MSANGLLQEFKRHIRMTSDDLDAELYAKLLAAVRHAEHHIGKVILRSEFVTTQAFSNTITLSLSTRATISRLHFPQVISILHSP